MIILNRVDLPTPLGPMTPTMPPWGSVKDRSSISTRSPKALLAGVRPSITFAPKTRAHGNLDVGEVELLRRRGPRPPCCSKLLDDAPCFSPGAPSASSNAPRPSSRFQALRQLRVLLALGGQACGLGLQVGGVVALVGVEVPAVHLADPFGHVVQEVAVVRDRQHRAGVRAQELFQPQHRLGVQVVRGLVEQQQVGRFQKQPAQRHAPALAARKARSPACRGRGTAARPWPGKAGCPSPMRWRRLSRSAACPSRP